MISKMKKQVKMLKYAGVFTIILPLVMWVALYVVKGEVPMRSWLYGLLLLGMGITSLNLSVRLKRAIKNSEGKL